jgi:hypothetical protein
MDKFARPVLFIRDAVNMPLCLTTNSRRGFRLGLILAAPVAASADAKPVLDVAAIDMQAWASWQRRQPCLLFADLALGEPKCISTFGINFCLNPAATKWSAVSRSRSRCCGSNKI